MKTLKITVIGQVQCVGFRYFTLTIAQQIGIRGWVKNHIDGSVEIRAVGTEEQLEAFLPYVQEGPRFGRVDEMVVVSMEESLSYSSFMIK